ncbi:hypothetical protein [Marinobacter sp. R17]|uniref:hypothetical protein n=1 Tax=Marinobacter sp. R17 TaxID=2484250 RepID=UPI001680DEF3|nr:hypothetical protein [Marinobacter sp. R17]
MYRMNRQSRMASLALMGVLISLVSPARADLNRLDDSTLSDISGQGGIYLSGDISINEDGGPIQNTYFGSCSDASKRCGARLAYQLKEGGGWMVLDDIRGKFSFEGLTLRVRKIDSGFGGDGALFNRDVLEIGLPNIVRYDSVTFKLATSSTARPTDPGFQQTDIFSVEMQGDVVLEGNLLVFPTGNP